MTYQQAEQYLLSFCNMPRVEYMTDPKHCDTYLKRLQFFLDILGNPEKKIPHYIHITGTSGKGSVTSFLHSILKAGGKKVGSTQSPHPTSIIERWKINDRHMSKKEFVSLVNDIKPKLDDYAKRSPYDMLSFFELVEALGFIYFAKHKVKWAILEAGCGGRFDSSNIIPHKDVAIITNIGLDHIGVIGKNKQEIAYEKAGIIKKGAEVFTLENNSKIFEIIKNEGKKHRAPVTQITNPKYQITKQELGQTKFVYKNNEYTLNTSGEHQIKNAILCIEVASSLKIPTNKIQQGLKNTIQPLRLEIISKKPLIIIDGAHNEDKIKSTVKTILELTKNKKMDINLVVGFSEDKDTFKMIKGLAKLNPKSIACTRNTVNPFRKVADPKDMAKLFKKILPETETEIFLDPGVAFEWGLAKTAKNKGLTLVTGSIFLSGELRNI